MKIVTYNVNGIKARLPRLIEYLAEEAPDVVQAWHDSHEQASRRGVFGTPTWIYNDVLYWGQDRLNFLDEALSES